MSTQRARQFSRRRFRGGLTLAGTAGLLGLYPKPVAAEPPPETTTLRLIYVGGLCLAPQYVAEERLGGEGFTDVQYFKTGIAASYKAAAVGEAHLSMGFISSTSHPDRYRTPHRPPGWRPRRML
jgi:NitT/TauT family transport system substrate-binding protein